MEKEKSSAGVTKTYSKFPEMVVIKGRLNVDNSIRLTKNISDLKKLIPFSENPTYSIRPPLEKKFNKIIKRAIDITISTLVIVFVFSWFIPLVALLIKIDSKGPVFFLQKRNKKDGDLFTCIKFRSMVVNQEADSLPATFDDERVTEIGKFLRGTFLDELPQFFNVWLGDMSLVGPRPHMISDNYKYSELIEFYDYRHNVKPGITGLSQVLGYIGETRNLQAMKNRVQMDIYYIRHWSAWLDLKIALFTLHKIIGL